MAEAERLQKVMAQAGVASRRQSEKMISEGHVKVNGKVADELGIKVTSEDKIEVDGIRLNEEPLVYYLFYKPRGVISAVKDNKDRKVVTDYFPGVRERIYPVGRLDYDTSGLLLMTNDGELANKMTHPKYKIDKTYVAKVNGIPSNDDLKTLRQGIVIDGKKTAPAHSKIISADKNKQKAIVSLTIHEGRNHQVKNMLAEVGHPVEKLKRETYGFLDLYGLTSSQYRELSEEEVHALKSIAERK